MQTSQTISHALSSLTQPGHQLKKEKSEMETKILKWKEKLNQTQFHKSSGLVRLEQAAAMELLGSGLEDFNKINGFKTNKMSLIFSPKMGNKRYQSTGQTYTSPYTKINYTDKEIEFDRCEGGLSSALASNPGVYIAITFQYNVDISSITSKLRSSSRDAELKICNPTNESVTATFYFPEEFLFDNPIFESLSMEQRYKYAPLIGQIAQGFAFTELPNWIKHADAQH